MVAQKDKALKFLEDLNASLRSAILKHFPCAYEQYVCISIPGTVIDTRENGSYLAASSGMTADKRNAVDCNEAMLVDSMVPLDKVMLGPTGKSVTRSYFTSLDMLVPRKTDVGTFDLTGVATKDPNSPEHKYTLAMEYLRKPAPAMKALSIFDNDVKGAKELLVKKGIPPTTVDVYVEKQLKWSEARQKWDAARNIAIEAREARGDLQNAASFNDRQNALKSAQNELHARWMDWVVNGDKLKVDYCFALVDRDTIMARIEKAKESTRDAMISSIEGIDWAKVHLEPENWAQLCRSKALAWNTRHPSNPAYAQLQLESLRSMKESYEAYAAQLAKRAPPTSSPAVVVFDPKAPKLIFPAGREPAAIVGTLEDADKAIGNETDPTAKALLQSRRDAIQAHANARSSNKSAAELKDLLWRVEMFSKPTTMDEVRALNPPPPPSDQTSMKNPLEKAEEELREAYNKMYELEPKAKADNASADDKSKLEQAKTAWLEKRTALQQAQATDASAKLSAGGLENLKTSVSSRITGLNNEISRIEENLGRNGLASGNLPDMITGVKGKDIEKKKPEIGGPNDAAGNSESADVWTNIAFSVNAKSDKSNEEEHGMSGRLHASAETWFTSVRADSSFSKNDKTVENFMSSASMSGSFSCMVVNIKRPWLHAELFQDFDIDIPSGTFLSPGAKTIKEWVETGANEANGYVRTNYGKFPAYPTAFIVAADTSLEFRGAESEAREVLSVLTTDSSVKASVGCWGFGGSVEGNLKTSDKGGSQHLDVQDGILRMSFQAPQIIGWVCEVLPELPRGDIPKFGGLNGAPMRGFRANL